MSASASSLPAEPQPILTVQNELPACQILSWPSETVPSSAFYAVEHWAPKAKLITSRAEQFGAARLPGHGPAKFIFFARVAFPARDADTVPVPEMDRNANKRRFGPCFFVPPADLPRGVERLEEVPHELLTHLLGDIKWPKILARRNVATPVTLPDGAAASIPILPSYLYDERVKYERWKVTILQWWENIRKYRIHKARLMRWQDIFQTFRGDFPSFPIEAGTVRRFSALIQTYERELAAGRKMAIANDLAPEDQHHRAAAASTAAAATAKKPAAAAAAAKPAAAAAAAATAAVKRTAAAAADSSSDSSSSSSSSSSDTDSGDSDDEEEEIKPKAKRAAPAAAAAAAAPAAKRAAPADAVAPVKGKKAAVANDSDSDSDSESSESESDKKSKSKKAAAAAAAVAAPAAKKKAAAKAVASDSDDSESESESETEKKSKSKGKSSKAIAASRKK